MVRRNACLLINCGFDKTDGVACFHRYLYGHAVPAKNPNENLHEPGEPERTRLASVGNLHEPGEPGRPSLGEPGWPGLGLTDFDSLNKMGYG